MRMVTEINLTGLQNSTTMVDMIVFANQVTNNLASGFLIFAIFFIMTIALVRKGYEFSQVILTSSFICAVLSVMLRAIGFVSVYVMLAFGILAALSLLFEFIRKKQS